MRLQLELEQKARDEFAEELHKKSEQLKIIFDVSLSGYLLINHQNEIVLANNAFSQLTGITQQEAVKLAENDIFQRLSEQAKVAIELSPASYKIQRIELVHPRLTVLLCGMREIYRQNNTLLGKVYFFHDITKNEEIDRIKNDFITHVTHELRTPLVSILGYSELLLESKIATNRQPDIFALIYEQSTHLVKIINELLDLTKIGERTGFSFTILSYSLMDIIEEVISIFPVPASRKNIIFYKPKSDIKVNVDRARFKQVLLNIIDNAYKYSQEDTDIYLSVNSNKDSKTIEIEIADHGIGMSADGLSQAFERFYRTNKCGSIPGIGLGLSLAKEIMNLLDGTITIKSIPGEGTQVTIVMPVAYHNTFAKRQKSFFTYNEAKKMTGKGRVQES